MSADTAASWIESNDNLAATNITGLSNPFWADDMWKFCASTYTNSAYITDVHIPSPTAISDYEQPAMFRVYPNPSDGSFIIETDKTSDSPAEISLFNRQGKRVYESGLQSRANGVIHLNTDLPAGIYMLRMLCGGQAYTEKILIY
jgi:hypothetical protein